MIRREDSLEYHAAGRPGKIELRATKPCLTPREMRLAYLPGAAFPVAGDRRRTPPRPSATRPAATWSASSPTARRCRGSAPSGPLAAKPMQEGIAVLFKRLADIDVFDLELDATDPDRFVETVLRLEPTFGGINLKDIRAPEGLVIYDRLREQMGIPVFHENLDSTAVVAAAALLNALELVDEAHRRGAGRPLRRRHRGHGLRPALPVPGRAAGEPPRLRREGPRSIPTGRTSTSTSGPSPGRTRPGGSTRACAARTSSSAPPPAASSARRWSARWPASRSCSPSRRPSPRSTTRRRGRAGRT